MNIRQLTLASCLAFGMVSASIALPVAALAQSDGSVNVTVRDTAGFPLAKARVTILGANGSHTMITGQDGRATFPETPGIYTVSVTATGFEAGRNDGIAVAPGQSADVSFTLANVTLQTIGTVRRTSTSVNATSSANSTVSGSTFLDQGQKQIVNVLDQVPGVEINRDSSNAPGANSSISIRGAQPYESQILIDGHPVVSSANGSAGFNGTFINSLLLGDVEINKGPGNLPNTIESAVGGSLNFKTPNITSTASGDAVFGYDSFNGNFFGAKFSDTFGKVGVLVGLGANQTPGYLPPNTILYGGAVYPKVTAGTAYEPRIGVVDFGYNASQAFYSQSQLVKLSYSFSPQTSILLTNYSTQTNDDETGTNYQFVNATILPCIDTPPTGYTGTPNCTEVGGTKQNYTSNPNLGLIGSTVPINKYAPYPDTTQFDNEPIYSGEFRTVIGPGSFLARYYTGALERVITQSYNPYGVIPCTSPACPNGNDLTTTPPTYSGNAYYGEPYVEDTIDKLHGADAQYTVVVGSSTLTAGYDQHTDTATFGEYDPTLGPPTFPQGLSITSTAYSLRGDFQVVPKLMLEVGNYFSHTTYVGSRYDPRIGLVFRPSAKAAIRASFGTAYVAPYYNLLNPTTYVSQGTLNLATGAFKPETSSGYDLGTDVKVGKDNLISGDLYYTNIFNRYASVTTQSTGTYQGSQYTMVTQNGNQAIVRNEGLEVQFLHAPSVGVGFHTAVDLLRDYAFNQDPNVGVDSIFSSTSADNVQLPGYPYLKIRNDLSYTLANGASARLSSTSYGANNAFGQAGFTIFDGNVSFPVMHGFEMSVGATNLFNHDNYQAGGIYDGGYTFQTLGGGTSYTTYFFTQPRTVYLQLSRHFGAGKTANVKRTNPNQ